MAAPEYNSTVSAANTGPARPSESFSPPEVIKFGDLIKTHPEYNKADLECHEDLYEGGDEFRENIDAYLVKRKIEAAGTSSVRVASGLDKEVVNSGNQLSGQTQAGADQWEARKKVSWYTPHAAGLIDWLVSAVFYSEPEVIRTPASPYWDSLNTNADGYQTELAAIGRRALLDLMLNGSPFLTVQTPSVVAANQLEAERAGALDARLGILKTENVDDWECVGHQYQWVRTHKLTLERSKPFGPLDSERHLWTYITDKALYEYEVMRPAGDPPNDDFEVKQKVVKPHQFGALPVFPICTHQEQSVMKRIRDAVLALYNREASVTWLLNTYAFPVLCVKREGGQALIISDSTAVALGPSDDLFFRQPDMQGIEALFKDREYLKNNLYEVLQAMAVNALIMQGQNARQSAAAKEMDREPLGMLLRMFAYAMRSSLRNTLDGIRRFRNEPEPVELRGLERFDVISLKSKIENLTALNDIADFPPSARKWQVQDTALTICGNAPQSVKAEIKSEVEKGTSENGGGQRPKP